MILEQKEVFRIGSNPAFDPLVWNYTQRKICMFYILRKPTIPPLVLSFILEILNADRRQVLRWKSNTGVFMSVAGGRAVYSKKYNYGTPEFGKNSENSIREFYDGLPRLRLDQIKFK